MRAIYKYVVDLDSVDPILMPHAAAILSVQAQRNEVCVWAMVDTSEPRVRRKIVVVGTGHDAEHVRKLPYLGTVQLHGGTLVLHVFDGFEQP